MRKNAMAIPFISQFQRAAYNINNNVIVFGLTMHQIDCHNLDQGVRALRTDHLLNTKIDLFVLRNVFRLSI